jgi:hypothetical protein
LVITIITVTTTSSALPTQREINTVASLITSPTEVERINLLNDTDFLFDFLNPPPGAITSDGPDGTIVTARRDTFPAVVGNGIAMSVGHLGPCGLNTPHIHPRATEFNIAINGTLMTGMLAENGARLVMNTVQPGQGTIFPRGSIHFEQNLGCEPVNFVAAFSDEDPGTTSLMNQIFNLPSDVIQATMGGMQETQIKLIHYAVPNNVAFGVQECLQRCGINNSASFVQMATSMATSERSRVMGSLLLTVVCVWFLNL